MQKFNEICSMTIKWCLCAIVFAAPFSKSISEIAIALAIAVWAVKKVCNKDLRIHKDALIIPFLIFVVTIIPSFFNSAYPAISVKAFFTKVLKYVFLYFVMVESVDSLSKLKDILIMAVASIVVIMADGFIQFNLGIDLLHGYPSFKGYMPIMNVDVASNYFKGFPTASFPYPNDLAAWILLAIFPVVCVAIFGLKKTKARYAAWLISIGLFVLFFLTKARGAWIGLGLSTVYIAVSKNKIWLIAILVLMLAVPFLFRMEMAQHIFSRVSVDDRIGMWKTGWQIFTEHPVTGNGLNTFFRNFQKYRNDADKGMKGSYAHNCYLQMAADTGIIGLGGFLFLIAAYFLSVIKSLRKIRDDLYQSVLWGLSIGIFAFLVHSFFDTNLYSLNLATLFWFAIGLSGAISNVAQDKGVSTI
ncbi:MAG: O-antigen ligase family protein [Candidatus Omnitrophica bacterium]|nr:O-antigen ligase family protein [Candidatus Omnitrophota bacterium]